MQRRGTLNPSMSFFLGETSRPLGSKVTPWASFGSGIDAYLARTAVRRLRVSGPLAHRGL